MRIVLRVVLELLKHRIVAGARERIGISFFGTRESSSSAAGGDSGIAAVQTEGVCEFQPLQMPSASLVQRLHALLEADDAELEERFCKEFGSMIADGSTTAAREAAELAEKSAASSVATAALSAASGGRAKATGVCPLVNAFYSALHAFNRDVPASAKGKHDKRVWIFTNDDNPFRDNHHEQGRAEEVARDADSSGISMLVWYMNRGEHRFDPHKFYSRIVSFDDNDDDDARVEASMQSAGFSNFDEFISAVRKKIIRKRRLTTLDFVLTQPRDIARRDTLWTALEPPVPLTAAQAAAVSTNGCSSSSSLSSSSSSSSLTAPATGEAVQGGGESEEMPEIKFSVGVYNFVKPTPVPGAVKVDKRDNKPLQITTKFLSVDTAAPLTPEQIATYVEFGNDVHAFVQPREWAEVKRLGLPGLRLLNFRPRSQLRLEDNLRAPWFIYPLESETKGSTAAFIALHSAMIEKDLIAICVLVRARRSSPEIVALLPQQEEEFDDDDNDDEQEDDIDEAGLPPGFCVIRIPYADEVREVSAPVAVAPLREQVDAAKDVIHAMTVPDSFEIAAICNPSLQKHYALLESIVLRDGFAWNEEEQDDLRPSESLIENARPALDRMVETIGADQLYVPVKKGVSGGGASGKRAAAGAAGDDAPARKKARPEAQGYSREEMAELCGSDEVSRLKMPELKAFLKSQKQPVSGKKAELVQRVKDLFA